MYEIGGVAGVYSHQNRHKHSIAPFRDIYTFHVLLSTTRYIGLIKLCRKFACFRLCLSRVVRAANVQFQMGKHTQEPDEGANREGGEAVCYYGSVQRRRRRPGPFCWNETYGHSFLLHIQLVLFRFSFRWAATEYEYAVRCMLR